MIDVSPLPKEERGGDAPSVGVVRVARVLKGTWTSEIVRIRSGPLRTCCPTPVHYPLAVGQKRIFILPQEPREGEAGLKWCGSVLPSEGLTHVEARILRARAFREEYLSHLKTRAPDEFAAAEALAKEMRAVARTNPAFGSKAFDEAVEALVQRLKKEKVESMRAAIALDWPLAVWRESELWYCAMRRLGETRSADFLAAERERLKVALSAAGVSDALAEKFLKAVDKEPADGPVFPPRVPELRDADRDNLTTQFILEYWAFDRGRMFSAHGMSIDRLAGLDPARLDAIVPALYGSDDDQLRRVAAWAIEQIPGVHFIDSVVSAQLEHPDAWRALEHPRDSVQTDKRIRALIEAARKAFTEHGEGAFWAQLVRGECFGDSAVQGAIAALESADGERAGPIHGYLAAAMAARGEASDRKELSAAEYRAWFASHRTKRRR